ncbi:MAG TPA: hypothetical protein VFE00_02280, partial [Arthrobacter sp.]|nr:hypothetical protein [Arthrobacter sp.]
MHAWGGPGALVGQHLNRDSDADSVTVRDAARHGAVTVRDAATSRDCNCNCNCNCRHRAVGLRARDAAFTHGPGEPLGGGQ